MKNFDLDDVLAIEGDDSDELDRTIGLQRAINGGHWGLQGSYGRAMMDAIKSGRCLLGPAPARDYWGNFIPSRDQVQDGTKGSPGFVRERNGQDWLDTVTNA